MDDHAEQLRQFWDLARQALWEALRPGLSEERRKIMAALPKNHVQYRHADQTSAEGSARYFSLRDSEKGLKPLIVLYRSHPPNDPFAPDLVTRPAEDLIILAHEFGHFLSDREGHHTEKYRSARARLNDRERRPDATQLSAEEAGLVLAEEERAWELGGNALRQLGFEASSQFNEERKRSLATYRTGLLAG